MRDPKRLSEWYQLDYYRRPRAFRRWTWPAIWAALLVSAGWLGFVLWSGSATVFQAGPVSTAHAMFREQCQVCHLPSQDESGRTRLSRLELRTVSNEACLHCHDGADHHGSNAAGQHCASCHREHRGEPVLAKVADAHCLACHEHLEKARGVGVAAAFQDVSGFGPGRHPEFALWRDGTPKDPGTLRFNHRFHLNSAGVAGPDRKPVVLQCSSCHEPDVAREHMKPVQYERHCASCHPLSVGVAVGGAGGQLRQDADAFLREPAPHRAPAVVRAVLRDRYLQFARSHPAVVRGDPLELSERPLPGERPGGRGQSETEWAEGQLRRAERALFSGGAGCAFCHQSKGAGKDRLPEYAVTALRTRWLPHSHFSHDSHRLLGCAECHAAATSDRAADVLMPRIESCQLCHNPRAGARTDCVLCHRYHPRAAERPFGGTMTVGEVLGERRPASDNP